MYLCLLLCSLLYLLCHPDEHLDRGDKEIQLLERDSCCVEEVFTVTDAIFYAVFCRHSALDSHVTRRLQRLAPATHVPLLIAALRACIAFAFVLLLSLQMKRSTPDSSTGQARLSAALQQRQTRQRENAERLR